MLSKKIPFIFWNFILILAFFANFIEYGIILLILYIERSLKWINPKLLELTLFIPFLYYFYFYSTNKTRLGLLRASLTWEGAPGREFKPSISTLSRKIIYFNCPLKLCNNFIQFENQYTFVIL